MNLGHAILYGMDHSALVYTALVDPIRVTSDYRALLRSPAARTLVFVVVCLAPLAWWLYVSLGHATNPTLRLLYGIALAAPLCGIVVAIFSFLGFLVKRRRVVLRVDEEVSLVKTKVTFPLSALDTLQLFSKDGASYVALLPSHVSARLTAATAASGCHGIDGYVVEFPQYPNLQTFEVADRISAACPAVKVEKIGSV